MALPSRAVRAALGLPPRRPHLWSTSSPLSQPIHSTPCILATVAASGTPVRHFVSSTQLAQRDAVDPAARGWATDNRQPRAPRRADALFSDPKAEARRTQDIISARLDRILSDSPRPEAARSSSTSAQDKWSSQPTGQRTDSPRRERSFGNDRPSSDKWSSGGRPDRRERNKGQEGRPSRQGRAYGSGGPQKPAFLPPRKVDFGLPPPPDPRRVLIQLKDHCRMVGDGKDSRRRALAYGVRGEAVRQMAGLSSDEDAAAFLLEEWKLEATEEVDEVLRGLSSSGKLRNKKGGLLDLEGTLQAQSGPDAERSLRRYAMQSFLDWIEARLGAQGTRKDAASSLALIRQLRATMDLSAPARAYAKARTITRHIHLHVGPTNSGKTHGALLALCKARTGLYAGPLRLLAHEVWERINEGTVSPGVAPRACNLLTGEEVRVVDPMAGLQSCTVEMASLDKPVEVAVVDEIQMISDEQRGHAWTAAVLGLPAKEIHLCGEASAVPLIQRLAESCGDVLTVHEYKRLTPLGIEEESLNEDLSKIKKGDCVVAFSRNGIFGLKSKIEKATGLKCAVAYGSLPPETKSEQARLFNDPESDLDIMVASDAIGMGLNLKIKRVIFHSVTKWNGSENVYLSASQLKQIAGRAGRYSTGAEAGGTCTTLSPDGLPILKEALKAPIVPIEKAAIQPNGEAIASLSSLLGEPVAQSAQDAENMATKSGAAMDIITRPQRSLSSLYTDIGHLARVDSSAYFLSGFSQQHVLSPLVEEAGAGRLTLADRERFSNAPANVRDELVVRALQGMVSAFASGKLVMFSNVVSDLGLLEPLYNVEALTRKARAAAKKVAKQVESVESFGEKPKVEREDDVQSLETEEDLPEARSDDEAQSHARPPEDDDVSSTSEITINDVLQTDEALVEFLPDKSAVELDVNVLMILESLHRCLSLYLWLSFRFPLNFCFQADVEDLKARTEVAIPFVLEAIRAGRRARLQSLAVKRERELRERKREQKAKRK